MSGTKAISLGRKTMAEDAPSAIDVSVVVVVNWRPEHLPDIYLEYAPVLRATGRSFEFLFIGATPNRHLLESLNGLVAEGEPIRILEVGQNFGETALLRSAVSFCRGSIILTLPSYRRVEPTALLDLIDSIEHGADVVVAYRYPRRDSWINRVQNRASGAVVRAAVGSNLKDLGCGVRAIRSTVLRDLPLYGDFNRFLPIIALREGFTVEEVPAAQHQADARARFHTPGLYMRLLIDVIGLFFLIHFREKPLRFFGLFGVGFSIVGAVTLALITVQRLAGRPMADRPLLLLGMMFVVLGIQVFALGLIGEIIVHFQVLHGRGYRVRERSQRPETIEHRVGAASEANT